MADKLALIMPEGWSGLFCDDLKDTARRQAYSGPGPERPGDKAAPPPDNPFDFRRDMRHAALT